MSLEGFSDEELKSLQIPAHIAVVMDGNGRWARQRGLPRLAGHYEGRKTTKRVVQCCSELGVEALSLYAFSTENWTRPDDEVSGLLELIEHALYEEARELNEANVVVRVSGRLGELPLSMQRAFAHSRELTAGNTGLKLNLCINYGGRAEIVDAAKSLVAEAADGKLTAAQVTEETFSRCLYAAELPEVGLLIRPGGEMRLSNFLLWEVAYAEIVVLDVLWPDFTAEHLVEALRIFNKRERRFGGIGEGEDD